MFAGGDEAGQSREASLGPWLKRSQEGNRCNFSRDLQRWNKITERSSNKPVKTSYLYGASLAVPVVLLACEAHWHPLLLLERRHLLLPVPEVHAGVICSGLEVSFDSLKWKDFYFLFLYLVFRLLKHHAVIWRCVSSSSECWLQLWVPPSLGTVRRSFSHSVKALQTTYRNYFYLHAHYGSVIDIRLLFDLQCQNAVLGHKWAARLSMKYPSGVRSATAAGLRVCPLTCISKTIIFILYWDSFPP